MALPRMRIARPRFEAETEGQLRSAALGRAPSAAELMQRRVAGDIRRQQLGMASAQGGNQALAFRQATEAGSRMDADAGMQAAQLRAAEQERARQLQLQQQGARQQQINTETGAMMQTVENVGGALAAQGRRPSGEGGQGSGGSAWQTVGQVASVALPLALALFSDERGKTDISPADDGDVQDFLGALRARRYRYRGSDQPQVGVMAQDVRRGGPMGREMVHGGGQEPMMIDVPRAVGATMAGLGNLDERMERIERALGRVR